VPLTVLGGGVETKEGDESTPQRWRYPRIIGNGQVDVPAIAATSVLAAPYLPAFASNEVFFATSGYQHARGTVVGIQLDLPVGAVRLSNVVHAD